MLKMEVRDDVIWLKHLSDDPIIHDHISKLRQREPVALAIEGTPVRFQKMDDGKDGRPTPGIKPADAASRKFWKAMQERRGELVKIAMIENVEFVEEWAASMSTLLSEWHSAEDAAAYDEL